MKILYLILAGGDTSHLRDISYTRNSWVRNLPDDSAYFELFSDPCLETAEIRNHQIWANCGTQYTEILRKTVISLQALLPVLDDYDFIVRTNVSSYFDHQKIEKILSRYIHKEDFYGGYVMETKTNDGVKFPFVSGAAIFWNPKTAKIISRINPDVFDDCPDDVAFSRYMKDNKVNITFLPRGNICSHGLFTIASHYRLKSSIHSELAGMRINSYHNFTITKNILKKLQIILAHQKTEISYLRKGNSIRYFAECLQLVRVFLKYRFR